MNRYILFIFVSLFSIGLSAQGFDFNDFDCIVEAEMKGGAKKMGQDKGAIQTTNYDLYYHRLKLNVNPEVNYISGNVTSYFTPVIAGFNEIYFDLSSALTVDSVIYNNSPLTFSHLTSDALQVSLPTTIPAGTIDSITIFYQGAPVNSLSLGGTFVQSSHLNDSIIWTLSEPYGAMEWWPCKQDLNDKIDSTDIIVQTPLKYRVGSQGLLINETTNGPDKIYHWKHRYPIPAYLISLAVTNYSVYSDTALLTNGNLEILNYVYPEDSAMAVTETAGIVPMLQVLDTLLGDYPFMDEKYGHAQFGRGGGMEHQTMSSMGNFSFFLMAHELAHQWFGDKVTCGSWEDIWLNEGFASYITGLMHKYLAPAWWESWKVQTIDNVVQQPDGSVFCSDTTDVSRIFNGRLSYSKGAYVLRMLEWKLGRQQFFQGIRNYLNDPNLAYGYAKTVDLKAHLETASGQNLTEFFNDWYYGEGHPIYQVAWNQVGTNASFTVNQNSSDPSVSFFEMPIPIYVKGQGFDTTFVFDHQYSGELFNVTIPFVIDSVFFDPDLWILTANPSILSVDEFDGANDHIKLFPNPGTDQLNIWVSKTTNIETIVMYNSIGQQITPNFNWTSSNYITIPTGKLSKGTYIMELTIEGEVIRKKWSKL